MTGIKPYQTDMSVPLWKKQMHFQTEEIWHRPIDFAVD
jgi:hypothetical protein